ncbi:lipopolysaccharide biosynthesis protein [Luteimonas suaedae]|uniref:lipopolysaccharide biosynthesis protein n=1 Tax=Luteimonas suaedae TaxID=2605430 RepID=UPI00165986B4|nr:polysaccharide biosynthesis C-terminal domain-containing protein [Luteimonas suaedae]
MNGLFRDAFTILFARGFIRLAQLLSFVLLARFLSPAEFGWFGIVTTAITLSALLGGLGLRQSVAYQIGREQIGIGEGAATALAVWPLLAAISAAIVFLTYGKALPGLSPTASGGAIFVGVAGTMLVMLLQGVFLGRGDIRAFSATEALPRALLALFALLLAATAATTILSAIWAYALAFALAAPVAARLALRGVSGLRPKLGRLKGLIGYGIPFAFNLFLVTLCSRLSMFVIEHHFDAAAAGLFFAAVRVNEIVLEAATAFGLVVFSRSVRDTKTDQVLAKTARVACWIFWSFTLGAALVALFAPLVLQLLLGSGYSGAGDALRVLAFGLGAAAANKIIYPAIAGQGRPLFGTPVMLASLVINLLLALWLVPKLGINGGALALVLGQYLMLIGYIITCRARFNVAPANFLVPSVEDFRKIYRSIKNLVR